MRFVKIQARIILASLLLALFSNIQIAYAATIYLSPSTVSQNIGSTFSIGIYVSSADQAMNASSGTLSFPTDKLEVTGVSTAGSVISLWVQQPSFSNSAGTVSFEGIVLNPGYTGSSGKVISVSFRTKAAGTANITFSGGSVLANDGAGTNILQGLGSARVSIEVPTEGPAADTSETPSVITGTPPAPQITSDTHPDPEKWYNNNRPKLSWNLPAGTTASQLLVGNKPQADPTVIYTPAISSRQLDELEDGTWYFHVRLRNQNGWGSITHFKIQIDTVKPDHFDVTPIEIDDLTEPTRRFTVDATDATSGIDHYEIQIDDSDPVEWKDDGNHVYQTGPLGPGRHNMVIKAVDGAGNFLTNVEAFTIDPIDAPVITDYPRELQASEALVVRGTALKNAQVTIWLAREKEDPMSFTVNTDSSGNFTYIHPQKLSEGVYKLWAETVDSRGAKSEATDQYTVLVQKPAWWRIGTLTANILSIIIPLIALAFLLVAGTLWARFKMRMLRRRIKAEAGEAQVVLHKEFELLKRRIRTHVTMLEKTSRKRSLTKEEEKMVMQFRKDLDYVEAKVAKEIKDIQKQVK